MSACWQLAFSISVFLMWWQDILIDKFWSCVGLFERLDNVYGFSAGIDLSLQ